MSDIPSEAADHSDGKLPRVSVVAAGLAVYVGVFAILFLDSLVWNTHYADRWIPTACHVPMRIFFYPMLLICNWLGWLPGGLPPIR